MNLSKYFLWLFIFAVLLVPTAQIQAQGNFNNDDGAAPVLTRTLTKGSEGDDVRALQTYLSTDPSIYPEGQVTGYFGPLTEAAVQRWQRKHGVVSDGTTETTGYGVMGPRSRSIMQNVGNSNPDSVAVGNGNNSSSLSRYSGPVSNPQSTGVPSINRTLSLGSSGEDVTVLQQYLAQFPDVYPEGIVTGYFGPLTQKAVQAWQTKKGIVSFGTPETTGFGVVGPQTRRVLMQNLPAESGGTDGDNEGVNGGNETEPDSNRANLVVTICHEGTTTLRVDLAAMWAHINHGDTLGTCDDDEDLPLVEIVEKEDPDGESEEADEEDQTEEEDGSRSSGGGGGGGSSSSDPDPNTNCLVTLTPSSTAYISGEDVQIDWDQGCFPSSRVLLEVRRVNGNASDPFIMIYSAAPNTGTYPYPGFPTGTIGSDYWIVRVTNDNPRTIYGQSQQFQVSSSTPTDTTPPIISNATTTGVGTSTATIAWDTDEAADSTIYYATSSGNSSTSGLSFSNGSLVTNHSLNMTNLSPGTTYYFILVSADTSGNQATSTEYSFVTDDMVPADTTPPVITNVQSTTTATTATISWTTDEQADSRVVYANNWLDLASTTYSSSSAGFTTSHSITLSGLTAISPWFYKVISTDAAGNTATSSEYVATTTPPVTPPVISSVQTTVTGSTTATVTWDTDVAANSTLVYAVGTTTVGAATSSVTTGSYITNHSLNLTGLTPDTTYTYFIRSSDVWDNTATSSEYSFSTDTTPPNILFATTTSIGETSVSLYWETNEPANSSIYYATSSGNAATSSTFVTDSALVTNHSLDMTGLATSTTYYFLLVATDAAGNTATSTEYSVMTKPW